jgi:hypothetical protein
MLLVPVVLAPSLGALAALYFWPGTVGSGIYAGCKCVLYGIPCVVAFYRVTWREVLDGFRRGIAGLGFAVVGGGAVALVAATALFFKLPETIDVTDLLRAAQNSGLDSKVKYWGFAIWLSIGNSGLEEFVFRWFVDSQLRRLGLSTTLGLLLSAAIFTAHHVFVLGAFFSWSVVLLGSTGVFIGGLLWSWSLVRWRSLLPGWCMHGIVDIVIFWIGAVLLKPLLHS